jgi:glycosyltransferase involved in cell wall biosynthesis
MTASHGEPFVSVVTPFYNTEEYLAECIESVIGQTYRNFEYILVDNQSTDRSGEIAADYAAKDSRIRLLRAERFLSQTGNTNFSVSHMSTEARYCKIAQADDWLFPRCLVDMVALAERHPSVAIVSSYEVRETEVCGTGLHPNRSVLTGREACRLHLLDKIYLFGQPTTVLYRSDVIRARKPFFEEGRLHPDTETTYQILIDHDFGFVHQVLSFIREQEVSISAPVRGFRALDRLMLVKRYGESYLDAEEYGRCLEEAYRGYYDALARRWLRQRFQPRTRSRAFWDYQHKGLASIGEKLRPELLMLRVGTNLVRGVLNPAESFDTVKRTIKR